MIANACALVDRFHSLRVTIVGDAMLDCYLQGSTQRLCREAPVPIVDVGFRRDEPGGAANTAANVCALGAQGSLLSVVGEDEEGRRLRGLLEAQGIAVPHVLLGPGRRTLAKNRVMAQDHMLVRFDQGSTEPVNRRIEEQLLERLSELLRPSDAVIVSDYGYGVLTPRMLRLLAETSRHRDYPLIVDSRRRLPAYRNVGVTAVKPNFEEAVQMLGIAGHPNTSLNRAEMIAARGDKILEMTGAQVAAVTLDVDGALVFERGNPPYRIYARPVQQSRASGAGDTFVAALAMALASGGSATVAAEVASAAAAVVVQKEGTATCSRTELLAQLSSGEKYLANQGLLVARLQAYRREGRRIVLTNGCFDILHRGHVSYLNRAKALGDVLIVGVNTDQGVARLKGPSRPINTLEDRVQVLAALSCVDHLVAFDEDTPHELVRVVRPDLFVKGGDYTRERLPEASLVEQLGGMVTILPFVESHSTTGVIERIQGTRVAHGAPMVQGTLCPLATAPSEELP